MVRITTACTLLLLVLCSILSVRASECIQYGDAYKQYNVTLCPLTAETFTPIPLTDETYFTPTSFDDGVSLSIPLPFKVRIDGSPYDAVYIGTNGVLFFGASAIPISAYSLPVAQSYTDVTPIIAPYWSNLFWDPTIGNITYGTVGTLGYRQ